MQDPSVLCTQSGEKLVALEQPTMSSSCELPGGAGACSVCQK
jgi:hypothetical protein